MLKKLGLFCLLPLVLFCLTLASARQADSFGKNARVCNDLHQKFQSAGGSGSLRKLNFYLFDAAERGCLDLVERFVAAGADVGARDRFGNTALNMAARMGQREVIGFLLDQGSDVAKANLAGSTPLLRAVDSDRRRAVKLLLDAGADPNRGNLKGIQPLTAAAFNGNERVIDLLLGHGADPDHVDRTGKTAIIYAAGKGFTGIVGLLLEAGVLVNRADGHDLTPLMWAAGHTNDVPANEALATIELLISKGAEIDRRDDRGRSVLMIAAERGHAEMVRHLMDAGVDPLAVDRDGKRAIDLAANDQVRRLLENL